MYEHLLVLRCRDQSRIGDHPKAQVGFAGVQFNAGAIRSSYFSVRLFEENLSAKRSSFVNSENCPENKLGHEKAHCDGLISGLLLCGLDHFTDRQCNFKGSMGIHSDCTGGIGQNLVAGERMARVRLAAGESGKLGAFSLICLFMDHNRGRS